MSEYVCKIERLTNGFEVEITDPKIVEYNNKRDNSLSKGPYKPYKDPKVSYAFKSVKEVVDFLSKNLDKAVPIDEFESSFDVAAGEDDD